MPAPKPGRSTIRSSRAPCAGAAKAPRAQLFVKDVDGGVRHLLFLADMRGVATRGRGEPALGVDALDVSDRGELACPLMRFRLQQQPRDRLAAGRIGARGNLADHLAAVIGLPGRTREMLDGRLTWACLKSRVRFRGS